MKNIEKYLGLETKDVADIIKNVRKEYLRHKEYRDDDEDLDTCVYKKVKKMYGDSPDKLYLAIIMMDVTDLDIKDKVKDDLEKNWGELMMRITG